MFVVFDQCLRLLLAACMICHAPCAIVKKAFCGTMVIFEMLCENGHVCRWESQPRNRLMPEGNIQIATGIFSSGSCATKAINSLKHIGVAIFTIKTYLNIQANYIIPAVNIMWWTQQNEMLKGNDSNIDQIDVFKLY